MEWDAEKALRILQEWGRRQSLESSIFEAEARAKIEWMLGDLFGPARAFVSDPSLRKTARTGRRAGKTNSVARMLFIEALKHPGAWAVYIGLTRTVAQDQLWQVLLDVNEKYNLGGISNSTRLQIRLPNGAVVALRGADKKREVEKLRGYKICVAGVDEGASFGSYLAYLMEEVLEPATMDVNGTLFMVGTPANHCMGYFYEATQGTRTTSTGMVWDCHHWTALDNPYLADPQAFMDALRARKQWAKDNPIFLREYMGIWTRSDEDVIYHFDEDRNVFDGTLPVLNGTWSHGLGIDLGASDDTERPKTAFSVSAYSTELPNVYFRESFKNNHMTPSQIAKTILELQGVYGEFNRIVCDTGALGKAIVEEITTRFEVIVWPAEKQNKYDYIELMDDDLRTGKILVDPEKCQQLVEEWHLLQWDPDDKTKEDKRFPNHCADSALYNWRDCLNWIYRPPDGPGPEPGTPEFDNHHAQDMFEQERQAVLQKQVGDVEEEWWNQ